MDLIDSLEEERVVLLSDLQIPYLLGGLNVTRGNFTMPMIRGISKHLRHIMNCTHIVQRSEITIIFCHNKERKKGWNQHHQ